MPQYNFLCNECKKEFKLRLSVSKLEVQKCIFCETDNLRIVPKNSSNILFENDSSGEHLENYINETKESIKEYKLELSKEWDL